MIRSESIANLATALIKAKSEFNKVVRDSDNPFFKSKYADLSTVIEATEAALRENGLTISQFPHNDGDRIGVQTILLHTSGEFLQHEFALPIAKHDAQTGTAAITYARRSALKAVLGVAEEDDDGNTASVPSTPAKTIARPNNPDLRHPDQKKTATVPKAEIPNGQQLKPTSDTQTTSASDPSLPTVEELNEYRKRFAKLVDALSTSGLKSSKGFPLQKKVLAFLLKTTGSPAAEQISKSSWEQFFAQISQEFNIGEGGISKVVEAVNSAVGGAQ